MKESKEDVLGLVKMYGEQSIVRGQLLALQTVVEMCQMMMKKLADEQRSGKSEEAPLVEEAGKQEATP